jgi:hypothetical protein
MISIVRSLSPAEFMRVAVKLFAFSDFSWSRAHGTRDLSPPPSGPAKLLNLAPDTVTSNATERCVVCNCDTGVSMFSDVKRRVAYLEGAGQLCHDCYRGLAS